MSQHRRGVVLVIGALMMPIICGFAALAIDAGYLWAQRSLLQNAADASALAGASALPDNVSASRSRARTYINRNPVMGGPVDNFQIEPGRWEQGRFVPTERKPNALRVSVMRNEDLFFAPVLGIKNANVRAVAIATHGGQPRNIMLVLDNSGSMRSDGKLEGAQLAATTFVEMIQDSENGSRVGVVFFDSVVNFRMPLSEDFSLVTTKIQDTQPGSSTNIAAGLAAGWQEASDPLKANPNADPIVILLSDGRANRTGGQSPDCLGLDPSAAVICEARNAAEADRPVVVHAISLGNDADRPLMRQVADLTGGEYYHAPSASELDAIFAAIAQDGPLRLVQ